MSVMSFDPIKFHRVSLELLQKYFPQIPIHSFLGTCTKPIISLPFFCPTFFYSVYGILRVSGNNDLRRFFETLQSRDNSSELHTIIGSSLISLWNIFLVSSTFEYHSKSSRSRIGICSSIGVNMYKRKLFFYHICSVYIFGFFQKIILTWVTIPSDFTLVQPPSPGSPSLEFHSIHLDPSSKEAYLVPPRRGGENHIQHLGGV